MRLKSTQVSGIRASRKNAQSTTTATFPRVNHLQLLHTIRHNTSFVIVIPVRIPDTRVLFYRILTQTTNLSAAYTRRLLRTFLLQENTRVGTCLFTINCKNLPTSHRRRMFSLSTSTQAQRRYFAHLSLIIAIHNR